MVKFKEALFTWRNLPRTGEEFSPNEKMFGRNLRRNDSFLYVGKSPDKVKPVPKKQQFAVGDWVLIQGAKSRKWNREARITGVRPSGSYFFRDSNGVTSCCNEVFIRKPEFFKEPILDNSSGNRKDDIKSREPRRSRRLQEKRSRNRMIIFYNLLYLYFITFRD